MFINPIDLATVNAMCDYRAEQLQKDARDSARPVVVVTVQPSRTVGVVGSARQIVGMAIIRVGARLAGIGLQTRMGPQL